MFNISIIAAGDLNPHRPENKFFGGILPRLFWPPPQRKYIVAGRSSGRPCLLLPPGIVITISGYSDSPVFFSPSFLGPRNPSRWSTEALPRPSCLGHPAFTILKQSFSAFGPNNVFLEAKISDFRKNFGSTYENLSFGQP